MIAIRPKTTPRSERLAPAFEPIRVALPSEEVARRLADAIRTGFFPLGSRLPSERSLAEQMQVSRPTIREALKHLVEENILSIKAGAGGGAFVISEIVPLDFLVAMPEMRPGEVDEALEVRRLILPWVAQVAARYAADEDFDRMAEALAFGRASLPGPTARVIRATHTHSVIIATMRFDLAVAHATRNRLVVRLMESLLRWVEPLRFRTLQDRANLVRALDLAEAMMRAIESGDVDRVQKATEDRLVILETALETQSGRRLRRKPLSA